ncbi:MAG: dihydropteroate synthase [Woeseiaceae bacterium]
MHLTAGKQTIALDRPVVMGVLNVTTDSFSDGGQFLSTEQAILRAEKMIDEGAGIVDVGGESTRPGSTEVPLQEELDRVLPVVEKIAARFDTPVSIDTSKPEVMLAAFAAGAAMINDVYALQQDGALEAAASTDAAGCLMHMQGTPSTMQQNPQYELLVDEISAFLSARLEACQSAGIAPDRLLIDPGFGFGKTDCHNLELLARLDQFTDLGMPMLVGLSRKRTLRHLAGRSAGELAATGVAAAVMAIKKGARVVRTHDVAITVAALKLVTAVREAGTKR